jgi:hypothetical protein
MRAAGEQIQATIRAPRRAAEARASLRSLAARASLLSLLLLALFAAPASAVDPPEYFGSFGPDGTEASEFAGNAQSVAVDQQTQAVYVLAGFSQSPENGSLFKFDTDGKPVPFGGAGADISGNEVSGLSFGTIGNQVAVDSNSHTVYVTDDEGATLRAFQPNGEPALFSAGPGVGTNEIGGFSRLSGIAVDENGTIYAADCGVGECEAGVVKIYAASGEPLTEFSTAAPSNLAVDTNGFLYIQRRAEFVGDDHVGKFTPSEFPVTASTAYTPPLGPFSPQAAKSVAADPATNDVYIGGNVFDQTIGWYDENGNLRASFAGPGEEGSFFSAAGLAFDAASKRLFVARGQGVGIFGPEVIFVGAPTIESTFATDVSSDSATLNARINPNTGDTTYRFEYGLGDCAVSACAGVPLGGGEIGSGREIVAVSQNVGGLQPGTTYHYRVVATSSLGTTVGPDRTFTTYVAGADFRLPDRRAWEMVSPPDKGGGRLIGSFWGVIQAAANGNALAYLSLGSIEADPAGNRAVEASSVLARRGADSWHSKDITPPHAQPTRLTTDDGREYKFFSSDLSKAVLSQRDDMLLSPAASERTPYLRHNTEPPSYTPLVTGKEGFANVPAGTEFGGDLNDSTRLNFSAATPDLSFLALKSAVPLVAGAQEGALYEWESGELGPLSELPGQGGEIVRGALGSEALSVRGGVSNDGGRVFWSSTTGEADAAAALYLRDTVAQESVRLDVPQPGASEAGNANPIFQGASSEGRVVFFTDTRQLTAGASPSGRDLYRCEIPLGSPTSGCASLTDISAPRPGSGESTDVQGIVSALSDDGTRVYFVAKGVLDTAPNEAGESAVAGEPNLYLWQEGEGARFVARLSSEEDFNWGGGGAAIMASNLTIVASPSGRYLTFMSQHSLTGYDNRDPESGVPIQEVFRYDAVADRLDCISCDPTGAAATATMFLSGEPVSLVDPREQWDDRLLAASVPQATAINFQGPSLHRPRSVLDNGRVFFNAFDSLVPADSNGQWDVYQHEPLGVGDCSAASASASTALAAGGCISLISSGTADEEAAFLDASVTGDDAFFMSSARLSVTDVDDQPDVYDARVDGVTATLTPSAECLGEACQAAVQAPSDPTPGTAALRGAGNQKAKARKRCPKGKRRVRRAGKVRCVPRKRRSAQQRRAGREGRADR